MRSRLNAKVERDQLLSACRGTGCDPNLTARAQCKLAFWRWRNSTDDDLDFAPVEVEVGALLDAEVDLNIQRTWAKLEQMPIMA